MTLRALGASVAAASLAVIALLTLASGGEPYGSAAPFLCVRCADDLLADFTLNVLLFVPFGAGLHLAGVRLRLVVLLALGVTGAIEWLQHAVLAGRQASAADVVANVCGAGLGALLAPQWRVMLFPAGTQARNLLLVAVAAWSAAVLAGAWGVSPVLDAALPGAVYLPRREGVRPYHGELLAASIGAISITEGALAPESMRRLREGEALRIRLRPELPSPGLAPIISIVGWAEREMLTLGQVERDFVVRVRLRADEIRLRSPALRLRAVAPSDGRGELTVAAMVEAGRLRLAVDEGAVRATSLSLSPALGWSLFLPYLSGDPSLLRIASILWMAALSLPVGFWAARWLASDEAATPREEARRDGGRWSTVAGALLTMALALGAAPPMLGLPPVSGGEWAGSAAGVLVGVALAGASRVVERRRGGG